MGAIISAVIITYNEEEHIGACLESIAWVDEIIVIDAESTDRTVDLCMKYTDKVYIVPWKGFAAQKNYGIDQATGTWVLCIDADERITIPLRQEIELVLINDKGFDGFYIPRRNYLGARWMRGAGLYPDYQLRLFRRCKGRFINNVHEVVSLDGSSGYLKEALEHLTYNSLFDYVQKINAYTSIEAKEETTSVEILQLFLLPLKTLLVSFFLYGGWKDGKLGAINSIMRGYYVFLKYAKIWEKDEHKFERL
ncbi:MAG: glycosyltransferase family 2 protein [bacterium]|jgi:(heptosyl)LPS beta-1,4-glucosyltransferase